MTRYVKVVSSIAMQSLLIPKNHDETNECNSCMYIVLQLKTAERKYRQCKVSGSATVLEELKDDVEGLRYMLQEIKRSVDTASKNPNRFRLTNAEIQDRKAWMEHVGQRVEQLSSNIWTMSQRSRVSPYGETRDIENDRFIETEMSHQEQIVARQDQDLDVLGDHVLRIGELGREMGQELDAQGQLLDDFGYEMQGTQTRLAAAQRKVQYVLDRAGVKGQLAIIAILVVVLVVLMVLIIS